MTNDVSRHAQKTIQLNFLIFYLFPPIFCQNILKNGKKYVGPKWKEIVLISCMHWTALDELMSVCPSCPGLLKSDENDKFWPLMLT